EMKPSSRISPYIRFEQEKKLHRQALEIKHLTLGYDDNTLISDLGMMIEAGERVAIIGPNGIGKTTFLQAITGNFGSDQSENISGTVKWAENATLGYCAQGQGHAVAEDRSPFDWMSQWARPGGDEEVIRGVLGKRWFSKEDSRKKVSVISGGEKGRMLF